MDLSLEYPTFQSVLAKPSVTPIVFRTQAWDELLKAFTHATGLTFITAGDGRYLCPLKLVMHATAQATQFAIYEIHPTYGTGLSYTLYQLSGLLAKCRNHVRVLYFGNDEIWISPNATTWDKVLYIVSEFLIAFHGCLRVTTALKNVLRQLFAFKAQDSGTRHYKRVVVDRIIDTFATLRDQIYQYWCYHPFAFVCIVDNLNLQTETLAKCDRFLRVLYEFCHRLNGWLVIGYSAETRIRLKWAGNEPVVSHLFIWPFTLSEAQLFAQAVIPLPEQAFFTNHGAGHWNSIQSWTGLYPKELVCLMQVPLRCPPETSTSGIFDQYAVTSMNDLKPVFKWFIRSEPCVLQTQRNLVRHVLCGKPWRYGLDYTRTTFFRLTCIASVHPAAYQVTNLHKGMELLIKQNQFNLGQSSPSTVCSPLPSRPGLV
ncbi:hypothetical protein H4R35_001375 [Dimargaris xerosporica]|nr:hypothetical protein H4R35_001375 [Dimargaris xerosporica]